MRLKCFKKYYCVLSAGGCWFCAAVQTGAGTLTTSAKKTMAEAVAFLTAQNQEQQVIIPFFGGVAGNIESLPSIYKGGKIVEYTAMNMETVKLECMGKTPK